MKEFKTPSNTDAPVHDDYTIPKTEFVKVPGTRSTEPGLSYIFDALKARDKRAGLNPDKPDQKEEILDSIRDELQSRGIALKYQVFEIGRALCSAKKILAHGEFKPWVAANFDHSFKTAHNCMKVFEVCAGNPEFVEYFTPSCLYVICSPKFPEDLRKALFDNISGPVDVTKKDVVEIGMKYKMGAITIHDEPIQKLLREQKQRTLFEKHHIELKALKGIIENRFKRIKGIIDNGPDNPLIQEQIDGEEWEVQEDKIFQIHNGIEKILAKLNVLINELEPKSETVT
ncbi:MAG: DUF3102 domain-containing protein [Desulfobacter postgatei]|uniref:DUF3102 domain-containing protein n=1 Tax=Desulfobacter postgatei TaxID=2293 RepID=UPI0023F44D47|nr:DUF3102 domain-containing protein [Desulfobacter postgatei]MDD4274278.1 DUF3102 domain-containing protein [Desulfobacter postgatei]